MKTSKEEININCLHYSGDGYLYDLIGIKLYLCDKCEKKLRKQIIEQKKLEESLK